MWNQYKRNRNNIGNRKNIKIIKKRKVITISDNIIILLQPRSTELKLRKER